MSDLDLDSELQRELDQLDMIFRDGFTLEDSGADNNARPSLSGELSGLSGLSGLAASNEDIALAKYELAEAEVEKENLHDQLRLLQAQLETALRTAAEKERLANDLTQQNERLKSENDTLRAKMTENERGEGNVKNKKREGERDGERSEEDERETIETLQKSVENMRLVNELTRHELETEKLRRKNVERERDVFRDAYEGVVRELEKWIMRDRNAKFTENSLLTSREDSLSTVLNS